MRPSACVNCGKTGYGIAAATIGECSRLLELELALFPRTRVFPPYLQAGPSFTMEKTERTRIAEDIAAALREASGS